jgi:hypothetical protein
MQAVATRFPKARSFSKTPRATPASSREPPIVRGDSAIARKLGAMRAARSMGLSSVRTVDLAQVVGKYIGETEKNLEQLFDQAERTGAILFFDESDELYSSESESATAVRKWLARHRVILGRKRGD